MLVPFTWDRYRGMEQVHVTVHSLFGEWAMTRRSILHFGTSWLSGAYAILSQAIRPLKFWFGTQKSDLCGGSRAAGARWGCRHGRWHRTGSWPPRESAQKDFVNVSQESPSADLMERVEGAWEGRTGREGHREDSSCRLLQWSPINTFHNNYEALTLEIKILRFSMWPASHLV